MKTGYAAAVTVLGILAVGLLLIQPGSGAAFAALPYAGFGILLAVWVYREGEVSSGRRVALAILVGFGWPLVIPLLLPTLRLRLPKVALNDLRTRFSGRISTELEGEEAGEAALAAAELFRVWNPVNRTTDELRSVLGRPTRETPELLEYVFDNGEDGDAWRFEILDDIVTGVTWEPLD